MYTCLSTRGLGGGGVKNGSGERPRQSVSQTECARKYCMPSTTEKQKKHKKSKCSYREVYRKGKETKKEKEGGRY